MGRNPKNVQQPAFLSSVPRCANAEQYSAWKTHARIANPGLFGFCTDCTPLFQLLMKQDNRCENPHIKFKRDPEGHLVGYVPSPKSKEIDDEARQIPE